MKALAVALAIGLLLADLPGHTLRAGAGRLIRVRVGGTRRG
jgi:hypothetical protein